LLLLIVLLGSLAAVDQVADMSQQLILKISGWFRL
jgi:hypothetical protein